jgi:RNA polymerase sigma factor (sigma-70 family)
MAVTALSDAELLLAARNGDHEAAFTELYVRHHAAARRLAASYRRAGDIDDLVNGAFERVLGALRRGGGPSESFRAYLFVTLRRLAMEEIHRAGSTEDLEDVPEPVVAVAGTPDIEDAEREMVTEAFESLPVGWQAVLWHTAVEGRPPREIADGLGLTANATAALAYRARERLRQAYLQAHLQASPQPRCEPHRSRLGGYVREGLSRRDRKATVQHLEQCESCQDLVTELSDVNKMLVRSVAPLFLLGGAAASKVAGLTAAGSHAASAVFGASAASVAGGSAGAAATLGGAWGSVRRAAATVGGAAAAAAAAVALAITTIPHDGERGSEPRQNWVAGAPEDEEPSSARQSTPGREPPGTVPGTTVAAATHTTEIPSLLELVVGLRAPASLVAPENPED